MGLPPTPESLGLDDDYDLYIDDLPPWERYKALKRDEPRTNKEWSRRAKVLWFVAFIPALCLAVAAMPVIALTMIIPPVGMMVWLATFLPMVALLHWRLR